MNCSLIHCLKSLNRHIFQYFLWSKVNGSQSRKSSSSFFPHLRIVFWFFSTSLICINLFTTCQKKTKKSHEIWSFYCEYILKQTKPKQMQKYDVDFVIHVSLIHRFTCSSIHIYLIIIFHYDLDKWVSWTQTCWVF